MARIADYKLVETDKCPTLLQIHLGRGGLSLHQEKS